MVERVVVINPNSTQSVTDTISEALEPLRLQGGPTIDCVTLKEGPPGIETQADVNQVVEPLCALMADEQENSDAFVIACYSDPGLQEARGRVDKPVFGMAESGMLCALSRGEKFGVISLFPESVQRHHAYVEKLGLISRLAGDLPTNLGVLELRDRKRTYQRLVSVGRELIDKHDADVILLGCAGMAAYRRDLERELDVAVIDPTQAGVTMAIGVVRCGGSNRQ